MARRRIIPLFVPHAGCPHQCVFCDQRSISGAAEPVTPRQAAAAVEQALRRSGPGAELAFYGGSFTAIDPAAQEALLAAAQPFLADGRLGALRCSTRPDAVDPAVIDRLRRYGVGTVELGCQSMDEAVLRAAGRGHTAADSRRAVALLHAAGIQVVTQMMTGLPGDSDGGALATARALADLRPEGVRIYPTVVVEHTPLAARWRRGDYQPQSLDEAVTLCAALWEQFRAAEIPVLRVGLNPGPALEAAVLAGPYHPAFGELVLGRMFLCRARPLLEPLRGSGRVTLAVAPRNVSRMTGQHRANLLALQDEFSIKTLKIVPQPLGEWEICLQTQPAAGIVS